jgi:uncharacterized membrane protein
LSYEGVIEDVVRVVEGVGAAIMVVGGLVAFGRAAVESRRRPGEAYDGLRRDLGRAILLGLEVLIIADIIRTIVVEPTIESVVVLAAIVLIRIVLSFSLEVEIDGAWPWSRRRGRGGEAGVPEGGGGRTGLG